MAETGGRRNEALAWTLGRAGWTITQLANQVNREGRALGLDTRLIKGSSATRWINPEPNRSRPSTPRDPIPELVCHLLSERLGETITPAMLGWTDKPPLFAPAGEGLHLHAPWDARTAVDSMTRVVDRNLWNDDSFSR